MNDLLSTLPAADKLSAPPNIHGDATIITAVPKGESSYIWFIRHETKYLCISFEIGDGGYTQMNVRDRRICAEIPNCFDTSLAHYNGSIFIAHKQDAAHERPTQLLLSDVVMYKNAPFVHETWNRKWALIASFLEKEVTNCSFRPDFANFGVPDMWTESQFLNMYVGRHRALEDEIRESPHAIAGFGRMHGANVNRFQFVSIRDMTKSLCFE